MKRVILTAKDDVTCKVFTNMTEKILDENEDVSQSCVVSAESGTGLALRAFVTVSRENLAKRQKMSLHFDNITKKATMRDSLNAYHEANLKPFEKPVDCICKKGTAAHAARESRFPGDGTHAKNKKEHRYL